MSDTVTATSQGSGGAGQSIPRLRHWGLHRSSPPRIASTNHRMAAEMIFFKLNFKHLIINVNNDNLNSLIRILFILGNLSLKWLFIQIIQAVMLHCAR